MTASILALLLGAGALWVGGEQFVVGVSRLAERTRLPTILVGMVVAGFGTSTPELTVSVLATSRGEGALAIGNALGSNVANVLLALPIAALVSSFAARAEVLRRETIAVLLATALVVGAVADRRISRADAAILVVAFLGTMSWLAVSALRAPGRRPLEVEIEELVGPRPSTSGVAGDVARTLVGLAVVLASAERLVWGAGRVAREIGVSEATIGLTIVAVGTSLPEVVTSLIAARRGEPDLVLGNVLGSNIFNALLIVGAAGLVGPLELRGPSGVVALAWTAASALALSAFLVRGYRPTRAQALAALAAYTAFVSTLYVTR